MLVRRLSVIVVGIALPVLVSQLLPANGPAPRSPVVPLVLLFAAGALAGWIAPTVRAWMLTAAWVVVGAGLVLLSWTDLVLDVAPSTATVEVWRNEAFFAITGAVAVVSGGFLAGGLGRRRGRPARADRAGALPMVAMAVACVAAAGLMAAAFARTELVVQDGPGLLTVAVTDDGIEVTPTEIGAAEYRLVYESRSSRPWLVASVVPLGAADGMPRAVTAAEIATWIDGDWAALEPPFSSAASSLAIAPGERLYGGRFELASSPDGTGGALWYVAELDALRPWPPGPDDGAVEPAPWPIDRHVVVPVAGG